MFDIHQDPFYDDEGDELDLEDYQQGLLEEFCGSPEGKACLAEFGDAGMVDIFLYSTLAYQGVSPASAKLDEIGRVLYSDLPRKVTMDPEDAGDAIRQLRYFWQFLDRAYRLPLAPKVLARLDAKAIGRLERELANPRNWGMAKSIFMTGRAAGYDMSNQEEANEFLAVYNAALARTLPAPIEESEPDDPYFAPEPYIERPKRSSIYLRPNYSSPEERRRVNKERQKKLRAHLRRRG
jgi:hypothetical protein